MNYEFIGNLIMQDGFKVRYNHVETYSEDLRSKFTSTFRKHGYSASIVYRNDFAYCEITAVKKKKRYLDYAMILAALWALYRLSVYIFSSSDST